MPKTITTKISVARPTFKTPVVKVAKPATQPIDKLALAAKNKAEQERLRELNRPRERSTPFSMSGALSEAEGIYAPNIVSTNQYYDTLSQRLSDIEAQGLGTLKSGWAGSETLPSSGFYQQQRSDYLAKSTENKVGAEKQRAAELANIAAQKSSYARGAYLQGLTAPLVEQQRSNVQKQFDLQKSQLGINQSLTLSEIYNSLAQMKLNYGYRPPDEEIERMLRRAYGG